MPDVIKICYSSLLKNANGHKVNLITFENYKDFVEFPDYIMEKHKKGMISRTHLSDILRLCLLEKYGGLWIDATMFVSHPLDKLNLSNSFWSPKWKNNNQYYSESAYLIGILYSPPGGSVFVSYLKDFILEYFKNEDKIFAYGWYLYAIGIASEIVPALKNELHTIPCSKFGPFYIDDYLNMPFQNEFWEELSANYPFHRISYKEDYLKRKNGNLTYFGQLCNEWEKEKGIV